MFKSINESEFVQEFENFGREANFSYAGRYALFEYLEQLEEDTGEQIELDVIALCCEYSEYADLEELQVDYPDIEDMDDLRDNTTVIEFKGGFIIQGF